MGGTTACCAVLRNELYMTRAMSHLVMQEQSIVVALLC